jgi:hypothetical protein
MRIVCSRCGWVGNINATLIPETFGTEPHEMVRAGDPDTSRAAARTVDTVTLEEKVFNIVVSFGERGCIGDDVAAQLDKQHRRWSIWSRIAKLVQRKQLWLTGEKRLAVTGRYQQVVAVMPKTEE